MTSIDLFPWFPSLQATLVTTSLWTITLTLFTATLSIPIINYWYRHLLYLLWYIPLIITVVGHYYLAWNCVLFKSQCEQTHIKDGVYVISSLPIQKKLLGLGLGLDQIIFFFILLFFSAQIFYPFRFLLYPFCFLSHPHQVMLLMNDDNLVHSWWAISRKEHMALWLHDTGMELVVHLNQQLPILLNLLYLTAHFASKLLISFKSLLCSKFC